MAQRDFSQPRARDARDDLPRSSSPVDVWLVARCIDAPFDEDEDAGSLRGAVEEP